MPGFRIRFTNCMFVSFTVFVLGFPAFGSIPVNMDFEMSDSLLAIQGWVPAGCSITADTLFFRNGVSSGVMSGPPGEECYVQQRVGAERTGEELTFTGWYSAGDDLTEAGVWIAVLDRFGKVLQYGEAELPSSGGSWRSFAVSAPLNAFADSIEFGVWQAGGDTIHLDDFQLLLDGTDFAESPSRAPFGAVLDREFDGGSGIEFDELSDFQLESLALLGRVWTLLKYHHPDVCSGELNWDYELFRVLPEVLAATDRASREAALLGLFPSVEPVPPADLPEPGYPVVMEADHSWINGQEIGYSLEYLLEATLAGRHTGESYYCREGFMPVFFEEPYPDIDPSDDGYRLLSLYRFWGLVEYWFPYRYATDTLWTRQLEISLPDFVRAETALEYQMAVMKLAAAVGDGHCGIYGNIPEFDSFVGDLHVPVILSFVEGRWVITGFTHGSALESPLRSGDVIVSLDGRNPEGIAAELLPYARGSNPASKMDMLGADIMRGSGATAELVIERGGQQFELSVARVPEDSLDGSLATGPAYGTEAWSVMDSGFGFMDLASLTPDLVEPMKEDLAGVPGIVIDMRGYPDGFPIYEVADFLVPEESPFCVMSQAFHHHPGTFFITDTLVAGGGGTASFTGPVAIIVDQGSISSSEFHAMAWRLAPGARVFGHPTAGADGNVNLFRLPGDLPSGFSGLGIYYPDGSETQRVGIQPDTLVVPTVEGLQAGRDELLEAAVNWLSLQVIE